jgi:predicted TIM-barrel fold metal-dependent hydrolase
MDRTDIDNPDYPERVVAELVRCHRMGARGVGEITDKGYGITRDPDLPPGKRLHPDDPRLDAFWGKCAELKMPVNLHVADHPSSRVPLDVYQERSPDFQHFNLFGKDIPSFDELIEKRSRTLEKHPETIFIACHLGNQGHDLGKLSQAMDRYPNLYLDTSARDYELGRTPRASAAFLQKYQDRILFGTDMGRRKSMYQIHWRLLETADEYIVGRAGWRLYGLELPAPVLESIYRDTALKIFNI